MAHHVLVIGNKNYSSWSMRPFIGLKAAKIPFEEKLVRMDDPAFSTKVLRVSKSGRVPLLLVDGKPIWDSLAILEYIADLKPSMWPANRMARATARSVCAEMHAGFHGMRGSCPVNIRRTPKPVVLNDATRKDIARIDEIWTSCRREFGKAGPYLFGKFSLADAMYTPVASRFETYGIKVSKTARDYQKILLNTPAYLEWKEGALKEPWIVQEDEVD
jgi:glutathione S-transferase